MESLQDVKNLTFDLIGTCYDWHTPVFQSLKAHAAKHERLYSRGSQHWSSFAHQWRMEFFAYLGELARL
jgi:FMN phosphatase YigB (HAD superfamily)